MCLVHMLLLVIYCIILIQPWYDEYKDLDIAIKCFQLNEACFNNNVQVLLTLRLLDIGIIHNSSIS